MKDATKLALDALLEQISELCCHYIPSHAFADNEAACDMDRRLCDINGRVSQAIAALEAVQVEPKQVVMPQGFYELIEKWDKRSRDALPADAMLINKCIRELSSILAAATPQETVRVGWLYERKQGDFEAQFTFARWDTPGRANWVETMLYATPQEAVPTMPLTNGQIHNIYRCLGMSFVVPDDSDRFPTIWMNTKSLNRLIRAIEAELGIKAAPKAEQP